MQFIQKEFEQLEHSIAIDIKQLWKNCKPKVYSESTSPICHNGTLYNSPGDLCTLWKHYYTNLLNETPEESARYDNDQFQQLRNDIDLLNERFGKVTDSTGTLSEDFTINEIASVCKGLLKNKAPGYDLISNECLKHGGHTLYETLQHLFNSIVHLGYIPVALKHSIIVPIYKGKNKPKTSMNSYRGVSLTPTLNKVLDKLILCRL